MNIVISSCCKTSSQLQKNGIPLFFLNLQRWQSGGCTTCISRAAQTTGLANDLCAPELLADAAIGQDHVG